MKAKHTPGPWTIPTESECAPNRILGTRPTDGIIGETSYHWYDPATARANSARIVSCVNALEGLDPGAVRELIEAAGAAADILGEMDQFPRLRTALAALKVSP